MAFDRTPDDLSGIDVGVLRVLVSRAGRVTSRETLTRLARLDSASTRRVDVCLVSLRRALGADAISTVRQRGWILTDSGLKSAEELLLRRIDT
jgi:DNA-binding winged helix-turn-helix (wHTH) protein